MKNKIIVFLTIFIFSTLWFGCSSNKKEENKIIKIGVILPLTGPAAEFGKNIQNAIELCSDNFKTKIKYDFQDSQAQPQKAVTITQAFKIKGIKILFGPISTGEVEAIHNLVKNNIMVLTPTASGANLSNYSDVFRNCLSDIQEAQQLADVILKTKINKIGVLYWQSDWGVGFKDELGKILKNVKNLYLESYDTKQKDFKNLLYKLKNKNIEAIVLIGNREVTQILNQIVEIKMNVKVFGTSLFDNPMILQTLHKQKFKYSYISRIPNRSNSKVSTFINNYENDFKTEPNVFAFYGYDLCKILQRLVQELPNDGYYNYATIRKTLLNLEIDGLMGKITFKSNGDVNMESNLRIVTKN